MKLVALVLLICAVQLASSWKLTHTYKGKSFFDGFNFYSGADPTHGYVFFANKQQSQSWGLINANDNAPVYMGADHTSISSGSGRASVRISTQASFGPGSLFILDLVHMPVGCGTWPAFWSFGPNWPNSGEIDIIEGVNNMNLNQGTLHTSAGCSVSASSKFSGHLANGNCQGNQGCGIQATNTNSYGDGFNNGKGGVYAMEWTNDHIQMFFFPRNAIPGDVNSASPNPSGWGKPFAYFQLGGSCPANKFANHNIIFDLTFCGDWAGATFGSQCPGKGACADYVKNNPGAFANAYWSINWLKTFSQ